MAHITSARGDAIAYDTFGDPAAPPLVLVQGFSAQRLGWHPGFCTTLAERGFHVIRFDNRDVGQSQRYPQGGYSVADLADDTIALLDALGLGRVHLVGQSMGGMIGQLVATAHPSRLLSLGLLYTTASTRHFISADDVIAQRMHSEPPSTRDQFVAHYVADEATCASPGYPQDSAWLAELGGRMWDAGVDPAGVERQLQALLAYPDQAVADRGIVAPTAIIAGDGDGLISYLASEELHELIPGSTLRIFPGMGHELPAALWPEIADLLAANARTK